MNCIEAQIIFALWSKLRWWATHQDCLWHFDASELIHGFAPFYKMSRWSQARTDHFVVPPNPHPPLQQNFLVKWKNFTGNFCHNPFSTLPLAPYLLPTTWNNFFFVLHIFADISIVVLFLSMFNPSDICNINSTTMI